MGAQQQEEDGNAVDGGGSAGAVGDWGATEHMLLQALEELYKDSAEPDVRLGLLRVCLHILHRHGG